MLLQKACAALAAGVFSASTVAATFVYVSNAEDGDISVYTLQPDGALTAAPVRSSSSAPGRSRKASPTSTSSAAAAICSAPPTARIS